MNDITVILNGFKRPEYLSEQVNSLLNQSVKPKEIWLWVNHDDNSTFPEKVSGIDVIVRSSKNFKYHARFCLGLLAKTNFVAFFDDDTIPGNRWFENCIKTSESHNHNCILGGVGVVFTNTDHYNNHIRFGWPEPSNEEKEVDFAGHAWFMNKQLLAALWLEPPISLENGEDMQLSFLAKKYFKTPTICPPHPENDKTFWSSLKPWEYGTGPKASSWGAVVPQNVFLGERTNILHKCISNGWKLINF
jgi:glycosyltransferase involved in cell wall biosynthesis